MTVETRPVTGPDGDNPITDEQCKQSGEDYEVIRNALSQRYTALRIAARSLCARAWNARHGGE